MKKDKIPQKLKDEIMAEKDWKRIVELENKYSEKYLLDDDIIQHEIEVGNMPDYNDNYYNRKE